MKKQKKLVQELIQSIREGGAILRGEMEPALERYVGAAGVKEVRARLHLSQGQFARMIGIPRTTLQNWEQGRTEPDAPAKALLKVAAKHPKAVLDALHGKAS